MKETLQDIKERRSCRKFSERQIEPEQLEKGFEIIDQAMTDYENGLISDDVMVYRAGW